MAPSRGAARQDHVDDVNGQARTVCAASEGPKLPPAAALSLVRASTCVLSHRVTPPCNVVRSSKTHTTRTRAAHAFPHGPGTTRTPNGCTPIDRLLPRPNEQYDTMRYLLGPDLPSPSPMPKRSGPFLGKRESHVDVGCKKLTAAARDRDCERKGCGRARQFCIFSLEASATGNGRCDDTG